MSRYIHCNDVEPRYFSRLSGRALILCLAAYAFSHVEFDFPGSEKLGPSRNGRMERNFPVIPIFQKRGCTQNVFLNFRKLFPEFLPFHSVSDRKSRNFWPNGKRPRSLLIGSIKQLETIGCLKFKMAYDSFAKCEVNGMTCFGAVCFAFLFLTASSAWQMLIYNQET